MYGENSLNDLRLEAQPHGNLNDMGSEIFPEGLYSFNHAYHDQWNSYLYSLVKMEFLINPVLTEVPFILSHISQVKRATDSGADVLDISTGH